MKLQTANYKLQPPQKGFTLIEALVATSVFAFVVASIFGVYNSALQLDRKSKSQRALSQNARFIMEYIGKEIRNGSIYYAGYPGGIANSTLALVNQSNEAEYFSLSGTNIQLEKNSTTTNLNSADVRVTALQFYIEPDGDPYVLGSSYNEQPRVTVAMQLSSNYGNLASSFTELNLQSTFATRSYPSRVEGGAAPGLCGDPTAENFGGALPCTYPPPDGDAPTVAITAPTAGGYVAGASVTISATASDNVGVLGVQFKLDGVNIGTEDLVAPYSITWDSTGATNGPHNFTAVARDAASNSTTSAIVAATVDNVAPVVTAFDVQPRTTSSAITATFTATDSGTSHLKNAELWRATGNGTCTISVVTGCTWSTVATTTAAAPVSWTGGVGVGISTNNLTKSAGTTAWDSGAVSTQTITSGDGYVEFKATEVNAYRAFGLTTNASVTSYNHITYGIQVNNDGTYYTSVNGSALGSTLTYSANDIFRIGVEGGSVKYRKNGVLVYTSVLAPTYPLRAGASLFNTTATITAAHISSSISDSWSSALTDTPPSGATYIYGIHVYDNSNNFGLEPARISVVSDSSYFVYDSSGTLGTTLSSYWKMDEASGNRADAVGSNTLTQINGPSSATGKQNTAASFVSASSQKLNVADNASLSTGNVSFTVSAWVYFNTLVAGIDPIVLKWEGSVASNREYALYRNGGNQFEFSVNNSSDTFDIITATTPVVTTGTWYFVVGWYDATADTLNIQVNNGTVASKSNTTGSKDTATSFNIGGYSDGTGYYHNGGIDEVGFWKRTLTAPERGDLYNSGYGNTYLNPKDTTAPSVSAFNMSPNPTLGAVKATFTATDAGNSHFRSAELWRAPYNASDCTVSVVTGCAWSAVANTRPVTPITVTGAVGVTVTNGNYLSTTAGSGWDAGASSTQTINSGDGYIEFSTSESDTYKMGGLGNGDSSLHYADIEYAIYPNASGQLHVFEAGVHRGQVSTYVAGDTFRVAVSGGVVRYYKNGGLVYTSAVAPTYPLRFDSSFYGAGVTMNDVKISMTSSDPSYTYTNAATAATLTGAVGVTVSTNSMSKPGADNWNAGAISTQTIAAGDGYVEFTTNETNTYKMGGLGFGDTDQNYPDIEYAMYPNAVGQLHIYEAGVHRGQVGLYAAGDVFRVAVVSGVVKYYQNGNLVYSSTVAPTYPLRFDSSLYTAGATINNIIISSPASNSWSGTLTDVPTQGNSYIYGMRIYDMAGNAGSEPARIKVDAGDYSDPIVSAFDVQPRTTTSSVKATFTATDAGGSFLKNAELWRAVKNGTCTVAVVTGCTWSTVATTRAATNASLASAVGVTVSSNSMSKPGADSWNAGAISTQTIVSGEGYVEFTTNENNTYKMGGLGYGDTDQNYPDIEFAMYPNAAGQLHVYESGNHRGQVSTYVAGDVFRVAVVGGVVKYYKNGGLVYTSAVAPTYPLRFDSSLYSAGATMNNIIISSSASNSWSGTMFDTPTTGTYIYGVKAYDNDVPTNNVGIEPARIEVVSSPLACTPGTQTFDYTGGAQTFTVPSGCTSFVAKAWGAGGGTGGWAPGGSGGGGGFAQGTFSTTPGSQYTLYVGGPGVPASGGYNGGGSSGSPYGGGGGGKSSFYTSGGTLLMIAGGGGGGGSAANGGAGGGSSGQAGGDSWTNGSYCCAYGGGAGTSGGGGNGGTSSSGGNGGSGSANYGGSVNGSSWYGGGGGAGYYGGGAGAGGAGSVNDSSGGGGGSGYVIGSATSTSLQTGSGATPANSGDAARGSAGVGGSGGGSGSGGRIVITY